MKVRTYVNKENIDQVELLIKIEEVAFNFISFFSNSRFFHVIPSAGIFSCGSYTLRW